MLPYLVHILLGDKWAEVAPILSILAVVGYTNSFSQYNNSSLLVRNRPHWQTYITTASAPANILLFIVFGRFGLTALAAAYACKNLLLAPISTYSALFLLKITPCAYLAQIAPSIAAATVMSGTALLVKQHFLANSGVAKLFLLVPAGAVLYLRVLAFLDRNSLSELLTIARNDFTRT
jgi:O-antigen/teichoic acid export membrane protein